RPIFLEILVLNFSQYGHFNKRAKIRKKEFETLSILSLKERKDKWKKYFRRFQKKCIFAAAKPKWRNR
ncbi:MAG: hypothetical protein J5799_03150, partial [Bacteroidales bacterium]|nr:hypothetical protein [Bacteroidales bacterium]